MKRARLFLGGAASTIPEPRAGWAVVRAEAGAFATGCPDV